jgi:membrane fusion protein, copper/silver efflux system
VPAGAVLDAGTSKTVFMDRGKGFFEPRMVETGARYSDASGDRVEILKGLKAGERIVTSGTFLLNSESQMKSAGGGMAGMPGMPDAPATKEGGKPAAPDMPDMPGMPKSDKK